jgi:hypothetical protein
MFMFLLAGVVFYYTCSPDEKERILGLPNRWFWAIGYAAFCVLVECALNKGGHLVWEYALWNRSWIGVWLIFLCGYFHFFVAIILVLKIKTVRAKFLTVGAIWGVAVAMNVVGAAVGWVY